MLTAYETEVIHEYKIIGNATQAVINKGFKGTRGSASVKAARLFAKPEIRAILNRSYQYTARELERPLIITDSKVLNGIPTKDEYALKAWERSEDNSPMNTLRAETLTGGNTMKTKQWLNWGGMIDSIQGDKVCSFWIKTASRDLNNRDVVDVLKDLELLHRIFEAKFNQADNSI